MPDPIILQTPELPARDDGRRSGVWPAVLAILAAFGASLCCLGPILFVTLGVGAGLASTFEPLRPLFTALTVLGLGIGFYTVYGRPASAATCAPTHPCARPRSRRREKAVLWGATILALLFWSFNYWSILLV